MRCKAVMLACLICGVSFGQSSLFNLPYKPYAEIVLPLAGVDLSSYDVFEVIGISTRTNYYSYETTTVVASNFQVTVEGYYVAQYPGSEPAIETPEHEQWVIDMAAYEASYVPAVWSWVDTSYQTSTVSSVVAFYSSGTAPTTGFANQSASVLYKVWMQGSHSQGVLSETSLPAETTSATVTFPFRFWTHDVLFYCVFANQNGRGAYYSPSNYLRETNGLVAVFPCNVIWGDVFRFTPANSNHTGNSEVSNIGWPQ
jgi:hypothetical protein